MITIKGCFLPSSKVEDLTKAPYAPFSRVISSLVKVGIMLAICDSSSDLVELNFNSSTRVTSKLSGCSNSVKVEGVVFLNITEYIFGNFEHSLYLTMIWSSNSL